MLPSLSAEGQAALAPFLARPDDPSSPFGPAVSSAIRRPDDGSQNKCQTGWIDTSVPAGHFKIHLCSTGNDGADENLIASIDSMAESLWGPMTKGMGEPLKDCYTPEGGSEVCPGGDDKIDIYLLATNQCWESPPPVSGCWSVEGKPGGTLNAIARAVPAPPSIGNGSSGFILLASARATNVDKIKSDFAHEFFHILQFRHNKVGMAADTGIRINDKAVFTKSWFVEASAVWAEWEYVPATSPDEVHVRFTNDFQPSRDSLLENTPADHMYAAYIWPFFAEQEKGSGSPIFQAWVAAEGAADPDGINDAVDQQLPFNTHFRDFAVRNWNKDLPGHPIPKLYKDLKATDGTSPAFPSASPSVFSSLKLGLTSSTPAKVHVEAGSLSAQYDEITFEDAVRKVILKFDGLPAAFDVDLLVEINGTTWNLEHVDDKSQHVVYCRDRDGENVSKIIVISSEHDKTPNGGAEGDYEVEGQPSCCGELAGVTSFKAHVTANYSFSGQHGDGGSEQDFTTSQKFDISAEITHTDFSLPGVFSPSNENPTGTASEHDKIVGSTFTSTQDGDGPVQDPEIILTMDLKECTFTFVAYGGVEVSNGAPGTFVSQIGEAHAANNRSLTDVVDKISGGMSFPAHSGDWVAAHPDQEAYEVDGLGGWWFNPAFPNSENDAGSAQINWTFEPDPPLPNPAVTKPDPHR